MFYTMKSKFGVLDKFKILKVWWKIKLEKKWKKLGNGDEKYNFRIFNVES